MELKIRSLFPKVTALRLPQTFGPGLKKNFVYDLIHNNALDFTHKDSQLQFYNLKNLWHDIQRAIKLNTPVLNIAVEPVTAGQLAKYALGINFKTITPQPPFRYNMLTKYGKYLYKKTQVFKELKAFIQKERLKTKIAISNLAWNINEESEIIPLLKRYQITGVEIAPSKIWKIPTKIKQNEIEDYKNIWTENGIQIVAVTSLLFGHPELTIFESKQKREKTLKYLMKMIKLASCLGAKIMVFGSPKNRIIGKVNKIKANNIAVCFFKEIAKESKKYQICFGIEANPKIYGTDFINTTKDAINLVRKVNHPNFRIHLDTSTMIINKENFNQTLKNTLPYASHLHISEPGLKIIPQIKVNHIKIAKILKKLKYDKWVSIEMPLDNKVNHIKQIEKTLKFVKQVYA